MQPDAFFAKKISFYRKIVEAETRVQFPTRFIKDTGLAGSYVEIPIEPVGIRGVRSVRLYHDRELSIKLGDDIRVYFRKDYPPVHDGYIDAERVDVLRDIAGLVKGVAASYFSRS